MLKYLGSDFCTTIQQHCKTTAESTAWKIQHDQCSLDSRTNDSYEPMFFSESKTYSLTDSQTNDSFEPLLFSESKTNSANNVVQIIPDKWLLWRRYFNESETYCATRVVLVSTKWFNQCSPTDSKTNDCYEPILFSIHFKQFGPSDHWMSNTYEPDLLVNHNHTCTVQDNQGGPFFFFFFFFTFTFYSFNN